MDTLGVTIVPNAYLATMMLRASADAQGAFLVDIQYDEGDRDSRTFLFPTGPHTRMTVEQTTPAVIHVGRAGSR